MPKKDLNKIAEDQQKAFAQIMENAVKEALKGVDAANAQLQKERQAVEKELDAAKKARQKAEKEGERIAAEYFEQRRAQLIAFTQQEQMRQLVRFHLENRKSVEDICLWLNVKREYVENIAALVKRVAAYRPEEDNKRIRLDYNPKLHYFSEGRGGTIRFENNLTSFDMWWEFAGGDALALIGIPSAKHWADTTKLPVEQRDDTLRFIGEQVVADQAGGRGSFVYDDDYMIIYKYNDEVTAYPGVPANR